MSSRESSPGAFAVLVPVGPGTLEVERVKDLAESFAAYESGPTWFVMIDDSAEPRGLDQVIQLAPGQTPISVHHLRTGPLRKFRHGGGLCSQMLMGLSWVQRFTDANIVLKLDTDSLVINPVRERLKALFDESPTLGMAGAHDLTPNGTQRCFKHHGATIHRLLNKQSDIGFFSRLFGETPALPASQHLLSLIRTALANGYQPGEHCLGGGYALSREFLDRMATAGHLSDPMSWMNVDMAEDVMVALHVRAVDLKLANYVSRNEVFGVRHVGLPASPAETVRQNYGVIHAVKNDERFDEPTIRKFFKDRRAGRQPIQDVGVAAQAC